MIWFRKKSILISVVIMIVAITIVAVILVMNYLRQSTSDELIPDVIGKNCENPYEYVTEYIPYPIPEIEVQGDKIHFQQIGMDNEDTDSMMDLLYQEYAADLAVGIKDCFPEFDEEGKVSFARKSEDDYERYRLFTDFVGDKATDLLSDLSDMSENRNRSLECTTFQKDSGVELALVSMPLYSNVMVNVFIAKDFSLIQSVQENNAYQELVKLYTAKDTSSIGGVNAANLYHYRQRIFRKDENSSTEEQIIYYTYFIKEKLTYIIRYQSNYTLLEGQEAYVYIGDLQTQEVCRNTLGKLLKVLITE